MNVVTSFPLELSHPMVETLDGAPSMVDEPIRSMVPIPLTSIRDAMGTALKKLLQKQVESCWSDAGALNPPEWHTFGDAEFAGGVVMDCSYRIFLDCPPQTVWQVLRTLRGNRGWVSWRRPLENERFLGSTPGGRGTEPRTQKPSGLAYRGCH